MTAAVEDRAAELVELATLRGLRIAIAESLTGGLLTATIVSVPGAASVLVGAVVAYDTALKHSLLGVDAELLRSRGPVDDEVARQMARGVRDACDLPFETVALIEDDATRARSVEIGVATTGVAGPSPDAQSGQEPGTVWLGLSSARGERAVLLQLQGDRNAIRRESVAAALAEVIAEIRGL